MCLKSLITSSSFTQIPEFHWLHHLAHLNFCSSIAYIMSYSFCFFFFNHITFFMTYESIVYLMHSMILGEECFSTSRGTHFLAWCRCSLHLENKIKTPSHRNTHYKSNIKMPKCEFSMHFFATGVC